MLMTIFIIFFAVLAIMVLFLFVMMLLNLRGKARLPIELGSLPVISFDGKYFARTRAETGL